MGALSAVEAFWTLAEHRELATIFVSPASNDWRRVNPVWAHWHVMDRAFVRTFSKNWPLASIIIRPIANDWTWRPVSARGKSMHGTWFKASRFFTLATHHPGASAKTIWSIALALVAAVEVAMWALPAVQTLWTIAKDWEPATIFIRAVSNNWWGINTIVTYWHGHHVAFVWTFAKN